MVELTYLINGNLYITVQSLNPYFNILFYLKYFKTYYGKNNT